MKLKRFVTAGFILLLACSAAAATAKDRASGGQHQGPAGRPSQPGMTEMHQDRPGMGPGYMGILDRLAGTGIIKIKYHIEKERVYLDARQEALDHQVEQQELRRKLLGLVRDYDSNRTRNRTAIIGVLERMQRNQRALQAIQEKAMEKIRAIHEQEKKEIERAVTAEIEKLRTSDEEMERFVEALQQRRSLADPWDTPPDDM